jgi:large subunit ribosomal protein L28
MVCALPPEGRRSFEEDVERLEGVESKMSQVCTVCGKHPSAGRNVSHSHRVTNRVVNPNIQKVTIVVDGAPKKANVCTKCLKAGKVTRA